MNKTLPLNNLKTVTAMNEKLSSVFFICVEAIIYLILYNFHDCTFKIFTGKFSVITQGKKVENPWFQNEAKRN